VENEMIVIEKLNYKIRHGLVMDAMVAKLDKIMLRRLRSKNINVIIPFYLYQEGIFGEYCKNYRDGSENYEIGFFKPENMKDIASFPRDGWSSEKELLTRLSEGHKCYGVKYRGKVAAFTWCNFVNCHSVLYNFPLKKNEAYLYDAYTTESFRGRGIAPHLRFKLYEVLHKMGRNRFYSISLFFNKSAIRFKKKLYARPLILCLHFKKHKKNYMSLKIKNYNSSNSLSKRMKVIHFSSENYR